MKDKIKKKARQKSFFFEDYTEYEISLDKKNENFTKISPSRITFLFFVFEY